MYEHTNWYIILNLCHNYLVVEQSVTLNSNGMDKYWSHTTLRLYFKYYSAVWYFASNLISPHCFAQMLYELNKFSNVELFLEEEGGGEEDLVDGGQEVEEVVEVELPVDLEPVVKSPPEPTRVKSPEQILMRSPEPVNWTVPLDTGKTFTVTQNVHEG